MSVVNIDKLLEIGIALSRERDRGHLLKTILLEAMEITCCDGGTLYIKKGDMLAFEVMVTKSQNVYRGGDDASIDLPSVPFSEKNVCAYAFMHKELFNIADVYHSGLFDFSGPRDYDAMTGYHTSSMLVVPMEDERGGAIGVLQLINAMDESGNVIPFKKEYENIIRSLSSQAAICMTNMLYSAEIKNMLDSFVQTFVTAVDARSPYNANHTRNMARCGENFLRWLKETGHPLAFSEEKCSEFLMSVWLHDIGKLVIPLEVMDKQDRLGSHLADVEARFAVIGLHDRLSCASGRISSDELVERSARREKAGAFVHQINAAGYLSDEQLEQVQKLGEDRWEDADGEKHPWLTPEEITALSVRKGTLTDAERAVMQSHVVMTKRLLEQMHFPERYTRVTEWSSSHHELLNGKGYPQGLAAEQIPVEVRILTILDVFDALTASDRPYKPAMPFEKALGILKNMVKDGEIDGELLELFIESRAWEDGCGEKGGSHV